MFQNKFSKRFDMDLSTGILDLLTKLEKSLKCPTCTRNCEDPVRIKTCGHYFCKSCLKSSKNDHNCPKCNEFYEVKDLDYKNMAIESQNELLELRKTLEKIRNNTVCNVAEKKEITRKSKRTSIQKSCQIPSETKEILPNNIILYNNTKYHVNFVKIPNKRNAKGETPLHLACKKKKFDEVQKLVKQGVDINAKDYAGWAPLHEAVLSQGLEIVEYLLKKSCLINIPGAEYVTPLHQAASLGNMNLVKLLLKYGADTNMVDYTGLKPIDSTKIEAIKELVRPTIKSPIEHKVFEVYLTNSVSVYCHTVDKEQKDKLQNCKNIIVLEKMEVKKLTHFIIKRTHKMSFKILQAMLEGLQFLTQDSIDDYIRGNYFINIPDYVFLTNDAKLNSGIKKATISAILRLPKLFDGIKFYIEGHNQPLDIYNLKVDKEYLTKLIKAGGGCLLHRPPATRTCENEFVHPFFAPEHATTYRCCNFIIYPENETPELLYNMNELQHKSSRWLIDCIVNYEISE